jgi:hypothetical protein
LLLRSRPYERVSESDFSGGVRGLHENRYGINRILENISRHRMAGMHSTPGIPAFLGLLSNSGARRKIDIYPTKYWCIRPKIALKDLSRLHEPCAHYLSFPLPFHMMPGHRTGHLSARRTKKKSSDFYVLQVECTICIS